MSYSFRDIYDVLFSAEIQDGCQKLELEIGRPVDSSCDI